MTHPEGATSTAEELLQGALDAARAGYEVFPLKPEAKEPAVEGGFYAATRDEDQIREWWTGRYRGYAVGIATGRGSGLVVVDADDQETTKLVEGRLGPPDVRTKRGAHWYRQHPRDGRVVSGKGVWEGEILTKLDVKGDDALTEIPPSPGKTWANGIPD